jgi:methylmalonyl-CoA mutase cobalamin-binding subunit
METVLRGLNYRCLVYLAMIVICHMFWGHLDNLQKLFHQFREAHLKLILEKPHFFQKEVWYLGHVVSPEEVITNPEKWKVL